MATVAPPIPQSLAPRRKSRVGRFVVVLLLVFATLFFLAPVYVMVINGLKDKSYMTLSDMWKFPLYLNGGGFPLAWETLSPNMWASLRMVIPATIFSSLLGAVNGYLLSKWKFRGSDVIFTLILFGVTVVFNPKDQPVTVALNNLNGTNSVDWTVVMAAAVLSALPTALVYILLGRYFIRGLLAGSMKG